VVQPCQHLSFLSNFIAGNTQSCQQFLSGIALAIVTAVVKCEKTVKLAPFLFAVGTLFTFISWFWLFINAIRLAIAGYYFSFEPIMEAFFFFQVVETIGALAGVLVGVLRFRGFGGNAGAACTLQSGPPPPPPARTAETSPLQYQYPSQPQATTNSQENAAYVP
jgi:hypothetical protein